VAALLKQIGLRLEDLVFASSVEIRVVDGKHDPHVAVS
jgi:hypothetical protein